MPQPADGAQLGGVVARRGLVRRAGRAGAACARRAVERGNRRLHSIERRNALAPSRRRASAASRSVQAPVARAALDPVAAHVAVARCSPGRGSRPTSRCACRRWPAGRRPRSGRPAIAVPQRKSLGKSRAAAAARRGQREDQRQQHGAAHGGRSLSGRRNGLRARLHRRRRAVPMAPGCGAFPQGRCLRLLATALAAAGRAPRPRARTTRSTATLQGVHADYFDAGSSVTRLAAATPAAQTLDVLPTSLPALSARARQRRARRRGPGRGRGRTGDRRPRRRRPRRSAARKTAVIAFNFANDPTNQPWTLAADPVEHLHGGRLHQRLLQGGELRPALAHRQGRQPRRRRVRLVHAADRRRATCDYSTWATLRQDRWPRPAASAPPATSTSCTSSRLSRSAAGPGSAYLPGTESWINGDLSVARDRPRAGPQPRPPPRRQLVLHRRQRPGGRDLLQLHAQRVQRPVRRDGRARQPPQQRLEPAAARACCRRPTSRPSRPRGPTRSTSALDPTTEPTTLRIPRTYAAERRRRRTGTTSRSASPAGRLRQLLARPTAAVKGVSIRVDDDPSPTTRSRLLDTHPGGSIYDAPLQPGETFSDGQISVTTISAGGGSASVAVNLSAPPLDQQAPSAPTGLSHALLAAGLRLSWVGSGDNVGVSAYPVYRDGVAGRQLRRRAPTTTRPCCRASTSTPSTRRTPRATSARPRRRYVVDRARPKTVQRSRRGATDRTGPRAAAAARRRLRGGRLLLTAKARDRAGIARVELRIDGRKVRRAPGEPAELPLAAAARSPPDRGGRVRQARQPRRRTS